MLISTSGFSKRERCYYVSIETTKGKIVIRLYNQTPLHRDNFIKLAKSGFYNGVIFHRVIDNFMIQAGDPESRERVKDKLYGNGGPGYDIQAEIVEGLWHQRGVVAAARLGDKENPNRKSSGSQFYIVKGKLFDQESLNQMEDRINTRNAANGIDKKHTIPEKWRKIYSEIGGTPHLDTQYTVFGEVVEGYNIVEIISAEKTDKNDRPLEDIIILKTSIKRGRHL